MEKALLETGEFSKKVISFSWQFDNWAFNVFKIEW